MGYRPQIPLPQPVQFTPPLEFITSVTHLTLRDNYYLENIRFTRGALLDQLTFKFAANNIRVSCPPKHTYTDEPREVFYPMGRLVTRIEVGLTEHIGKKWMSALKVYSLPEHGEKIVIDDSPELEASFTGTWVNTEQVIVADLRYGEKIVAARIETYANHTLSVQLLIVDLRQWYN